MWVLFALALALALTGCGDGASTSSASTAPPPSDASGGPAALLGSSSGASPGPSASALPKPFSSVPRAVPGPRDREGETSVEALFDRARQALAEGDDATLVRCLEPAARRRWLGDALLTIEIEVQIPRYEDQLGRRRALGALHDLVKLQVGREGPARPSALSPDAVEGAMLDRVKAPDALLADLLTASRALGYPLDPVAAAQEGQLGPSPASAPPAVGLPRAPPSPPAGLARALRRIERAKDLAEVHLEDARGIALVRGNDGGLEPVRLVRQGDTVWIDES